MILSLQYWEQSTGKNKIDLAEESKLWHINVDDGRLRVRTLDRYLDINKLPSVVPSIRRVLNTALFVLDQSTSELPLRDELKIVWNSVLKMAYLLRLSL